MMRRVSLHAFSRDQAIDGRRLGAIGLTSEREFLIYTAAFFSGTPFGLGVTCISIGFPSDRCYLMKEFMTTVTNVSFWASS